jgi:aspartate/methionine/tyrosine aminotransferase
MGSSRTSIWVITDEIYEHLLYDGATAPSLPVLVPALADTCIILNGVAKTYAMTGWRVGWMIGPKDVIKAATNLQSHLTSNVSNVSQRAGYRSTYWKSCMQFTKWEKHLIVDAN